MPTKMHYVRTMFSNRLEEIVWSCGTSDDELKSITVLCGPHFLSDRP